MDDHKLAPTYAMTSHFTNNLGQFYGMWIALETTIEYQIGHLLKLPFEEVHIIVAGMEFGRKANLLRILINRSGDPNAKQLTSLLNRIQNEAKRNIFTHSLLHSVMDEVTFSCFFSDKNTIYKQTVRGSRSKNYISSEQIWRIAEHRPR